MKKILSFDVDQTLNIAKTPIPPEIAEVLIEGTHKFEICPISGQKFDQFIRQIVEPMKAAGAGPAEFAHLHLFVAQGTQYYRFDVDKNDWIQVYSYPLSPEEVSRITEVLEDAAKSVGFWEGDKVPADDEVIENRLSQVTFSALGQKAGTEEKYAWDPDHKKREAIVSAARQLAPEFDYEIGGTTSINVFRPGMNKAFGMDKLMEYLGVDKTDILYFGDMTQEGGNDYPVVKMGIDTITVRSHEDTLYALRGILGLIG